MAVFSRFMRYFLAVARSGSIRKASEDLNISASAIDRQILLGEKDLGAILFERLPNGMRLTVAGEALFDAARRWTKELAAVQVRLEDLRGLRRGHVRFAVIDALARGFVPRLIQQLREEHPAITTEIAVLDNARVGEAVVAGDAEFGLMLNPKFSRNLSVRAHAEIPLGVVSRPDHPLAARERVPFGVLAEYPVVAPGEPLALRDQLDGLETVTGVVITPAATCDNIQMIKSLVSQGVGVSILSGLDVVEELARGELAFTPLTNAAARPLVLALCVDPSRQLSGATRLLIGRIEVALGDGWA